MIDISPVFIPELDPGFVPAALWNRAYRKEVDKSISPRDIQIGIERLGGRRWVYSSRIMPQSDYWDKDTLKYCERLLKFLLWAWGGARVQISGAPDVAVRLRSLYSSSGARQFDFKFMGEACFGEPFVIELVEKLDISDSPVVEKALLGDLHGNRIGFDLGGSDRKCAAILDGKLVFSQEVKWSPYFESDPEYHYRGILDSLELAAKHLPSVDSIGGSAAGIYIDNEPRIGSLFRGVSREDFDLHIRNIFRRLNERWKGIPFRVENDGDVTALAGAMMVEDYPVLGISMGTSLASGYIDENGSLTGWLNELAFVPVDYRNAAPVDEWSGDKGCGVQYFSQQAIARLLDASGIKLPEEMSLPARLEWVQDRMETGDERIPPIYRTIGTYLGYTLPHYNDFYSIKHLLILGRVSSGSGGELILHQARKILDAEFPDFSRKVTFQTPDEKTKRHGQAIAAASLPKI